MAYYFVGMFWKDDDFTHFVESEYVLSETSLKKDTTPKTERILTLMNKNI